MYFPEKGLHFTAQIQYSVKVYIKNLPLRMVHQRFFTEACTSIKIDFHSTNWGSFLQGRKYPERYFTSIAFDWGTGFLKWTVHKSETLGSLDEGTLKTPIHMSSSLVSLFGVVKQFCRF
jgi:hypothetical protein